MRCENNYSELGINEKSLPEVFVLRIMVLIDYSHHSNKFNLELGLKNSSPATGNHQHHKFMEIFLVHTLILDV